MLHLHSPQAQSLLNQIKQRQATAQTRADLFELLELYHHFLHHFPDHLIALHNRAETLRLLGFYAEALAEEEKVLALKPDYASAWYSKAFIYNIWGDYKAGWAAHEWRWEMENAPFKDKAWPIPRWSGRGGQIGDKKLLICAEQGLGDNLQFVRYAIEATHRGLDVLTVNHRPLERLLSYNLA